MNKRAHILFTGDIDGTGYRFFLQQKGQELGLKGYIKKTVDGKIEAVVEGKEQSLQEYIRFIENGVSMQANWQEYSVDYFDTLVGYTSLSSEIV